MRNFIGFISLLFPLSLFAEVILDGTLGQSGEVIGISNGRGVTFNIEQSLGQTIGQNLFHSFEQFNLPERFDVALFSGADDIQNIMTRVTGGQSFINGTIRSFIPNVNFYLLNPHGVFFSEFASLDISGSFHVSTADTLYLGETGQFNAAIPENSILTTAAPSAFGFLTDQPQPAGLTLQGKGLLLKSQNTRLSLVSGDIHVSTEGTKKISTKLHATQQVSVASMGSKGTVSIDETGIKFSPETQGGDIYIDNLENISAIDVGDIFIRGGNIVMSNTTFFAVNHKGTQGKIDIQGDNIILENSSFSSAMKADGTLADISIQANNLTLSNSTTINTTPEAYGTRGGNIDLVAHDKLFIQDSFLKNNASAMRANTHAGRTSITAGQLNIENTTIESAIPVSGTTKGIHIQADDIDINHSTLSTTTFIGIAGEQDKQSISLLGKRIYLGEKAILFAGSYHAGQASDISITATEQLILDGSFVYTGSMGGNDDAPSSMDFTNNDAIIEAIRNDPTLSRAERHQKIMELDRRPVSNGSTLLSSGIAGDIFIQTPALLVKNYGMLEAGLFSEAGKAGNIYIAADKISISNHGKIASQSGLASKGQAGSIYIDTEALTIQGEKITSLNFLDIEDEYLSPPPLHLVDADEVNPKDPTGIFTHSSSFIVDAGNAGNIRIKADKLVLQDKAYIASSAREANGGNIHIDTQDLVLLNESEISTNSASFYAGTQMQFNAGNVVIENPEFVVMDEGQVITRASQGAGGDITINAQQFLVSNQDLAVNSTDGQNILNAASNVVERSGTVVTPQITEDITKQLLALPDTLGQRLLSRNCLTRNVEAEGSFKINNLAHYAIPPTQLHLANNVLSACLVKKSTKAINGGLLMLKGG